MPSALSSTEVAINYNVDTRTYNWLTSLGRDWWNEVVSRGGGYGVSDSLKAQIDEGLDYLTSSGDVNYIDRLWIWRGDPIAASVSLLNPTIGIAVAVNNPSFDSTNGYTFNGTSSYIDTQFNPYLDGVKYASIDDCLIGCDHYDAIDEYGKFDLGCTDGTQSIIFAIETPGGFGWTLNSTSYQTQTFYGDGNYFMKATTTGAVNGRLNGNSITTGHSPIGLPHRTIYSGAYNNNGTASNFKNVRQRFVLFGGYGANLSNLDTAMNTFFLA